MFAEVLLRTQRFLDPELVLHRLPARDLIRDEADIRAFADALPANVQEQFLGWFE